ncbi:MAG: aldo/keto reductase, partial [Pseudomonadota bacterium]|nr:aldo/keto reductase [Pseudomonadota bacterium]
MIPSKIKHGRAVSRLCFGAAQIGMAYGIANRTGMPDAASAQDLLAAAYAAGMTMFDTARIYGESEKRIGQAIPNMPRATIMTKLSLLEELSDSDTETTIGSKVEESVHMSLQCLGLSSLPYLLLHRAQHLHAHGGKIWQRLLGLRRQGVIGRLGVSVQRPEEIVDALQTPDIECLQLPFNILDRRYERLGIPAMLLQRPDMLVVARSALLQGLLTREAAVWPILKPAKADAIAGALDQWVLQFGRKNRVDLCLAYVRAQPWIDTVVVGMENRLQLEENMEMLQTPSLS